MKPDICIYHAPCQDGFTAAWAIWRRWKDCEFVEGVYGVAPPDVTGKHVLLVDFSFKRPVLEEMSKSAASITILDHHKSAQLDLETFAILNPVDHRTIDAMVGQTQPGLGNIRAEFDMTRSGAMMAWQFANPGLAPPQLVRHVQDRDLWKFALPHTREIAAVLFSHDYDFLTWDDLAYSLQVQELRNAIIEQGEAIERKHHKDVFELLGMTTRYMVIGSHRVPVANLPYTMSSDAANMLAEGNPFGACYYDNDQGHRVFSLRSQAGGADVSLIASAYGGGGHARAAGFSAPCGWEGE